MKITWICYLHKFTSMGVIAINVIKELDKLGYDVGFHVLNLNEININDFPLEIQKAIQKGFRENSVGIFFAYPDIYPTVRCKINVGYTGADSTGWHITNNQFLPSTICNKYMDYMLTPSEFSKKNMINCGTNIPIYIFPHGIDTNLLKPKKRFLKDKFIISYCGELSDRKGTKDLINTFINLFHNDEDIELHLRANDHMYYYCGNEIDNLCKNHNNIKLTWNNEGQEDISQYYYNSDLYIYPSKADWYGMTPIEALATGLPVIATATNGYYEFINHFINKLNYVETSIGSKHPYLKGNWFDVNPKEIEKAIHRHFLEIENGPYGNKRTFEIAAPYIHENFSWESVTKKYLVPFLDMVEKKHFNDERVIKNMVNEEKVINKVDEKRVTVSIPTKDRLLEVSLLLQSLFEQTYKNFEILIIDDCSSDILYSNTTIQGLFKVLNELGHNVTILKGQRKGPHIAGQMILENAKTELILRLDDDVSLRPSFIEELVGMFKDSNIGAVGPIYLNPHIPLSGQIFVENINDKENLGKVYWSGKELFLTGYLQSVIHKDEKPIPVEHLNSGFMYRKSAGLKIGGYCLDLSPVGHREESDFSYRIFKEGYKLFVNPKAISLHYHPMSGGIRESDGIFLAKENWDHDEAIFLERMKKLLPMNEEIINDVKISVIVLTHDKNKDLVIRLLDSIYNYTTCPCEIIIVNNSFNSLDLKDRYIDKHISINIINTFKELSVGEARNIGVENSNCNYICFIDDDSLILGRYNQTTDWLDYLYNEFNRIPGTGAFGPVHTWYDELKTYTLSTACLFTSKKVWNIVGGFDSVFGNKEKGTWGFEDTDWSYRVTCAGFKVRGIEVDNYPFYHENTTTKFKTKERELGLLKAHELLMQKYNINEINYIQRLQYPLTPYQMDIKGTKLNVGCYYMYIDGFINIDIQDDVGADLVCDLREITKHFSNNSVSLIIISQCLEHVNKEDAIKALNDFYNILKPNGVLIVEVPYIDDIDEKLSKNEISHSDVNVLLNGNTAMPYQRHLSTFEEKELTNILIGIGFKNPQVMESKYTSDQWQALRIDSTK